MICAMAAMFFGMAGIAPARERGRGRFGIAPAGERNRDFIMLTFDVEKIDLGQVKPAGVNETVTKLKAHVVANCPHHVDVSFSPFKHESSKAAVLPEHTNVTVNGSKLPAGNSSVSIVDSEQGTPVGGVDIPVEVKFGFTNMIGYQAGNYQAILTFTIMPRP